MEGRVVGKVAGAVLAVLFFAAPGWSGGAPDDRAALSGLRAVRAVVDLRATDADRMVFNLDLLRETVEGLEAQKVKPRLVVSVRGPGVRLFTREAAKAGIAPRVAWLKGKGVRIEVCAVAVREFQVDASALIPEVVLVGNGLNSLIGYQNRGYALVPLN